MTRFGEFLQSRLDTGGFTTEDALASFLPLAREIHDAHNAGLVGPLEGIDDLHVEGVRIWFEEAKRRPLRNASAEVRRAEQVERAAVEVVGETRITTDVENGVQDVTQLAIGDCDQPVTRPIYLPGYQAWEHRLGCHDPLTDIFSLGMILASLACGLDFHHRAALETFVANRKNLFLITKNLHPVVARAIVRMSEVNRRRRAQDLGSLLRTLENYRDQEVDFDFDLARTEQFPGRTKRDKQTVVLSKLRERLFEISRRNRLLHFRPTMQSVNLTHASVPLSFDIKNIRPEQVLTWTERLERKFAAGKEVPLNKYLNFSEVLYLPSQLQRLISETRRDQAEFGFAQLRLVLCFIHWANLKEKPIEQYHSPLILLPVELRKQKGIRDTYYVKATTSEAEINPVVRHQFQQLYDINLPEMIDLSTTRTDDFFHTLRDRIESSEAAVTLAKIDRPRIQLIHEKARRKLDQYRRRARLAGRGVRKFMNLDYSYDPANYHPLGIRLFSANIRPTQTHLREIIEENPRPRSFAAPEHDLPVVEKERQFYALQSGGEESPYDWTFDLCSVTLANFRYRRMSLVRDYEALLSDDMTNPAFDATFSLSPRAVAQQLQEPRPLDERFDVVPCDPTQARAIAEAASGKSYIIQGPPGTGKSQTITNLIADYVARGKRVLFVCEKRAAIDVVYARLRQCGLSDLCCLIHDSQADKKKFVMDLKQTYEAYLAEFDTRLHVSKRGTAVRRLKKEIGPLQRFDQVMLSEPPRVGTSVRRLLDRCIALRDAAPRLDPLAEERLPDFAQWRDSHAAIRRFEQTFRETGGPAVLAKHPLRILAPRLAREERPLELILGAARDAKQHLDRVKQILGHRAVPRQPCKQLVRARRLVDYARRLSRVVEADQVGLLDEESDNAKWFAKQRQRSRKLQRGIDKAMESTQHWREKLSPEETDLAIDQAIAFEQSTLFWLNPGWWRLRQVMNRGYDFKAHKIRPAWSHVLRQLQLEYGAQHDLRVFQRQTADELDVDEERIEDLMRIVDDLADWVPQQPDWIRKMHTAMVRSPKAQEIVAQIASAHEPLAASEAPLARISDDAENMPIDDIVVSLNHIIAESESVRDFLDCLSELQSVPSCVASCLRTFPYTPRQIEAAVCQRSLNEVWRSDKKVKRFTAKTRQRHVDRLETGYAQWLGFNSAEVRDRVRARFHESLHIAERSATKLSTEQKQFKHRYNRGRRELEHEFGKQMRYKAIRDLVADESGDVVKDLKPVWLMSPLSVSDTLPLDSERFDVVIFDEASQITLEEAVPALFRAPQSVIVGDQMQLPPTDFFSAKQSHEAEDEDLLIESDGELVQYDLDSGSFLNHAAQNLSSTMLGWHYRSRSESLISFSNWTFYDGKLLTVPEASRAGIERTPILASAGAEGADGARETLARPISFHRLGEGVYDKRRNRVEAEYIAEMVRSFLKSESDETIGIVAFSEAQQDEIEQAVARLGLEDNGFRKRLEAELEREDDGQFVGLLIKNLENIQGDERDIIILSVCYGHPVEGKMRMNFGPINKSGGEKRLNVAFSRAKKHMAVVCSIDSDDITNDYNDGANCLKNYLRYAQAVSVGNASSAHCILRGLARREREEETPSSVDAVAEQLVAVLTANGYEVDRAVGQSHFRCDLAVYRPGDNAYRLGILMDNESHYNQSDLLERDMMRPQLLRAFGWRIAHVLAKDWHTDPEAVTRQLLRVMEGETSSVDGENDDHEDDDQVVD